LSEDCTMSNVPPMAGTVPKRILASIRLINGALALVVPDILGSRLGVRTATSPGLGYAFRLFGVRTVLLGVQLWVAPNDPKNPVIKQAIIIHASDTAAAIAVLKLNELPRRGAIMAIAISAVNTVLALILNLRVRQTDK
jgi:hypothetical protein